MKKFVCFLMTLIFCYSSFGQDKNSFQIQGAGGFTSEEKKSPKSKSGVKFSEAFPEEINDKNYPSLIDTFDYPDIDIKDMVSVISELTGKRFILDSKVSGKITVISKEPITVAEAYKAFLSSLQMNGYTVVSSGKFLKIIKSRDAIKQNIEIYPGEYFPEADQMITKIIKLKYIPASQLDKSLRALYSKDGDLKVYEPTNSVIVSDYGSNVEKILSIIKELDVPGFEEKMEVIPIRFAKSKEIAELINNIINKGSGGKGSSIPRFRRSNSKSTDSSGKGAVSLDFVTSDDRTNSIIVLGNAAGISKAKRLVKKLDFKLHEDEEGGVYVYYVKYNTAEDIAKTLGGIAEESAKSQKTTGTGSSSSSSSSARSLPETAKAKTASEIFGGEVKIRADEKTNSLIITASPQDYQTVKGLLSKIDIPRDQVFVESIIMEMNVTKQREIGFDVANIVPAGEASTTNPANNAAIQGIFGIRNNGVGSLIGNPTGFLGGLAGGILTFGAGDDITVNLGGTQQTITSIVGLVKLIQDSTLGNVLSTPKIMAMDNEEAIIEVGQEIALGLDIQTSQNGVSTQSPRRKSVAIKLEITPSISPESEAVRLKLKQNVEDVVDEGDPNTAINQRNIETNLVVPNGDTAVLGGLVTNRTAKSVRKVPLLGDIPILGWLFRSTRKVKRKDNLLVFITPKIIRNPTQSRALFKEQLDKRLDFIKREMNGIDPHGAKVDELSKLKTPLNDGTKWDEDFPEELKEEPAVESF